MERKVAEWRELPVEQRKQLYGGFVRYFELSEPEKERILGNLFQPERAQTEKVVSSIENWPKPQQEAYMAALRQFTEMSPAERENFMKNAHRWQQMSLPERQAWRDLVRQISLTRPSPDPALRATPTGPTTK